MSRSCPSVTYSLSDASFYNVSELLIERWEDSPKDDRKRLEKCWGYNDCGDCHRSDGFCGWCAIVSLHLLFDRTTCRPFLRNILLFAHHICPDDAQGADVMSLLVHLVHFVCRGNLRSFQSGYALSAHM